MGPIARLTIFAAIASLTSAAAEARGPSFSCPRATGADELTICRSPALRAADARMASMFRDIQGCTAMGGHGDNVDDQRAWLMRRGRCGSNANCLARIYAARIAEFAPLATKARRLMRVESCPGPLR